MPPLYVTTQGAKLRCRRRRLVVEKDDQEIASVPAVHVDQVLIFGNVVITTPALGFLLKNSVVLRCLNNQIVLPDHFTLNPTAQYPALLNDEGRARFIRELETRLNLEFKHPDDQERVTWRRCFQLQARQMAHCIQTGAVYAPFRVR